ncbi:hypothetical protein ACS0TY_020677 [Phlomoides rotata]
MESPNTSKEEELVYKKLWRNWAIKKATITAWRIIKERVAKKTTWQEDDQISAHWRKSVHYAAKKKRAQDTFSSNAR